MNEHFDTYLSGRHVSIDIYPLSFPEFVDAYGVAPDKAGLLIYNLAILSHSGSKSFKFFG